MVLSKDSIPSKLGNKIHHLYEYPECCRANVQLQIRSHSGIRTKMRRAAERIALAYKIDVEHCP
jgi:hypothetical protein